MATEQFALAGKANPQLEGVNFNLGLAAFKAELYKEATTPLEKLLRVGFCRWNVEHGFRVSKSEIGFGHFEGRNYVALMRHLILCLLVLGFVAGHAEGLRGEKPGGNGGAGVPGAELGVRGVAGGAAGDDGVAVHVGGHWLPPAA